MAKCGTEKRAKRNVILSFQERDQRGQINVGEKAHIRERKKERSGECRKRMERNRTTEARSIQKFVTQTEPRRKVDMWLFRQQ